MDMNELRLKALRRVMGDLSQAEFAEAHDLNASYISQILSGHRSFGERAATNMEKKIGLKAGTLSRPPLAEDSGAQVADKESNVVAADFSSKGRLKNGELSIPQYNVRGALGHGQLPADYTEIIRHVTAHESLFSGRGISFTKAENLAIITGFGQSMEGTINDGDPLIVDRGINHFIGDGIYVLTWDGLLYIKRLQKHSPDRFDMISDNKLHKDQVINIADVTIHARVLLVWNAKKL